MGQELQPGHQIPNSVVFHHCFSGKSKHASQCLNLESTTEHDFPAKLELLVKLWTT